MANDFLRLYTTDIGNDTVSDMIQVNLKTYYDWALLKIGGWSEVAISAIQGYGGDYSRLRPVSDPNYSDGQVWETARKDFVWEQNIDYTNVNSIVINPSLAGVPKVNSASTVKSHYINYPLGQVVFDSPISIYDRVQLSHSYRQVQIYVENDISSWRELQFDSTRMDDPQFFYFGIGKWSTFNQQRVQFPTVLIKTSHGESKGWEIGNRANVAVRDVDFHILAENRYDRNNLIDIFSAQTDRKVPFFNIRTVIDNGAFPLNYRGERVGASGYEEFVNSSTYRSNICTMKDAKIIDIGQIHPNLHGAVVRTTMSIIV